MNIKNKVSLLVLLTIVVISIMMFLKPIRQDLKYHHFADSRPFLHIPNFLNVISNFLFVIVGCQGLILLHRMKPPANIIAIYNVLFIGILLTGFGSAYYHLYPNNDTLVYDRIPMTIVFMALLSAMVAEFIDLKAGIYLLAPLVVIGVFSVLWWHFTEIEGRGDLRMYGLVQFYPMLLIPLILVMFRSGAYNRATLQLVWVVVWYMIAKLLEQFDWSIFSCTGFVSGHSLKHIAAGGATWYLVRMFRVKYMGKNVA